MKKFIASILALCLILTTFSFTTLVQASEVNQNRAINVYVDSQSVLTDEYNKLYEKEYIIVTVKLERNEAIANAKYTLTYNPTYFNYVEGQSTADGAIKQEDGSIEHICWDQSGDFTLTDDVLATYKFEAIPQPTVVSYPFKIVDAYATNLDESIDAGLIPVSSNSEEVTILLKDYKIEKYLGIKEDGSSELIDETQGEVTQTSFPYDDKTHTFHVVTDPEATVEYYVNDTKFDNVEIKGEGEYTIKYVVTNKKDGYGPVEKEFKITIQKPHYVVEVAKEYYVTGKVLVIAYTNTPNVHFSYEKKDYEMVDVTGNNYFYDNPRTQEVEAVPYAYKFAYVASPTANDEFWEYEDNVKVWYTGETDDAGNPLSTPSVGEYTADINDNKDVNNVNDKGLDIDDISVAYGIANAYEPYFETDKHQYKFLRLDHDNNKMIRGEDTGFVVDEVKLALGF